MNEVSSPHDQTVIELLREGLNLADVYLATALEEVNEPGGQFALLAALSAN